MPATKRKSKQDSGTFLAEAKKVVKRGTRVTIANVKLSGTLTANVKGYVKKVENGYALIDTWGATRDLVVPVGRLSGVSF